MSADDRRTGGSRERERARAEAAGRVRDAERRHRQVREVTFGGAALPLKPGARLHPVPPKGWTLLIEAAGAARGRVLDASASAGLAAREVAADAELHVLEPSAAGLICLAHRPPRAAQVSPGLPWDAEARAFDTVLLAPPAERGRERVAAELAAAWRALRPGGVAWLLLHKDRGAKRAERDAARAFGALEVVGRSGGWRLSRARREDAAAALPAEGRSQQGEPWSRHTDERHAWWSLPGAFAAAKVDRGTRTLLEQLEAAAVDPAGADVLDLGCGTGLLAAWAARRGARVTAVDDDLAAVRSAARTLAEETRSDAVAVHGDLDDGLADEAHFDLIVCNPPFHVGSGVRLDLSAAFVAAARRRLRAGGEAWWVANEALPYEGWLRAAFRSCRTIGTASGFKVLRARA